MTAPGKPFVRPVLPPRGAAEEDAFVWGLLADARPDDVAALVGEALEAGRPQLAARLVGLLPEDVQDPDLDRGRAAARLVVQGAEAPGDSELDSAWRWLRERRLSWRSRISEPWIQRNPLDPFPPRWRRR
jgi:hypothetical protein